MTVSMVNIQCCAKMWAPLVKKPFTMNILSEPNVKRDTSSNFNVSTFYLNLYTVQFKNNFKKGKRL